MKLKSIVATLCFLVLAIAAFSAIEYYDAAREKALQENYRRSFDTVTETSERLGTLLLVHRQALARLASLEQAIATLTAQPSGPAIDIDQLLIKQGQGFRAASFTCLTAKATLWLHRIIQEPTV